jgi:hypothetical protein
VRYLANGDGTELPMEGEGRSKRPRLSPGSPTAFADPPVEEAANVDPERNGLWSDLGRLDPLELEFLRQVDAL